MKSSLKLYKLLLIPLFLLAHKGFADNGFYSFGFGSNNEIAGGGAALPFEATNVESNPSLLARMHNHWSAIAGFQYVNLHLNTAPAPLGNVAAGNQHNSLPWRPYGLLGFCMRPNERWALGFGTAGASLLVKYDQSIDNNPSNVVNRDNRQFKRTVVLFNPTIAYNFSCRQTYGVSLIVGASQLKTDLLGTSGHELASYTLGIGARIGGFWVATDWLNIGASISTPVYFQRNSRYSDVLRYHQDLPAIARLGFDFHCGDSTHILFDIKEIFYGEIKALGTALGWRNQTVFIIAVKQQLTCNLVGALGYNYGRAPIRSDNIMINGLNNAFLEHHFTGGFDYSFNECVDLTVSAIYAPSKTKTDNGNGILGAGARGAVGKIQSWGGSVGLIVKY